MGEKLHLFSYYTPSHKKLFDEWLAPTASLAGFRLSVYTSDTQVCQTAAYAERGWRETQIKKLSAWITTMKDNADKKIVCSDADVQIIKPCGDQLLEFLGNYDIAFQENDGGQICSGFFVCRCNSKTIGFFTQVLANLTRETIRDAKGGGEQYEIWKLMDTGKYDANIGMLPKDEIWNPRKLYEDLSELDIPKNMLVHHANWAEGFDKKVLQLEYVTRILNEIK